MITVLLIYIIGAILHIYGFGYSQKKDVGTVIDYPEMKEMEPLITLISWVWPLFWVVFLFLFLKDLTIKLIAKIKNENAN